ncbi:hypothetical protein RA276_28190, partial [Pseudomonas syringae pv. tagetis]|uniref:hypothetical protein n=1 Tax=Pseudomonas syringae group genomosp. 7 TaxID=251699 RepID=UPI00376F9F94
LCWFCLVLVFWLWFVVVFLFLGGWWFGFVLWFCCWVGGRLLLLWGWWWLGVFCWVCCFGLCVWVAFSGFWVVLVGVVVFLGLGVMGFVGVVLLLVVVFVGFWGGFPLLGFWWFGWVFWRPLGCWFNLLACGVCWHR